MNGEPICILGAGPAGLFAAQAVAMLGYTPVILSKKQKSRIYGAQYLHKPIPGLSSANPDSKITTFRLGNPERYAERVYGDPSRVTSWAKVQAGPQPCWNLRKTYERAWEKFEDSIADQTISARDIDVLTSTFDTVVSTIPLWTICKDQSHSFQSVPIFVKTEMEYTGLPDFFDERNNAVVYNGSDYGSWYRTSYIFGHSSTESRFPYPDYPDKGNDEWNSGFKVVGNNCDCHPNLVRAGRMGLWQNGVLTHHAFDAVVSALSERMVT